jgi:hypothetical protein
MNARGCAYRRFQLAVKLPPNAPAPRKRLLRVAGFSRYELQLFVEEIFESGCYREALAGLCGHGGCVVDVGVCSFDIGSRCPAPYTSTSYSPDRLHHVKHIYRSLIMTFDWFSLAP